MKPSGALLFGIFLLLAAAGAAQPYDPSNPNHIVFASTNVPGAAPCTTTDLQLVLIFAAGCAVLLVLSRV